MKPIYQSWKVGYLSRLGCQNVFPLFVAVLTDFSARGCHTPHAHPTYDTGNFVRWNYFVLYTTVTTLSHENKTFFTEILLSSDLSKFIKCWSCKLHVRQLERLELLKDLLGLAERHFLNLLLTCTLVLPFKTKLSIFGKDVRVPLRSPA